MISVYLLLDYVGIQYQTGFFLCGYYKIILNTYL